MDHTMHRWRSHFRTSLVHFSSDFNLIVLVLAISLASLCRQCWHDHISCPCFLLWWIPCRGTLPIFLRLVTPSLAYSRTHRTRLLTAWRTRLSSGKPFVRLDSSLRQPWSCYSTNAISSNGNSRAGWRYGSISRTLVTARTMCRPLLNVCSPFYSSGTRFTPDASQIWVTNLRR